METLFPRMFLGGANKMFAHAQLRKWNLCDPEIWLTLLPWYANAKKSMVFEPFEPERQV